MKKVYSIFLTFAAAFVVVFSCSKPSENENGEKQEQNQNQEQKQEEEQNPSQEQEQKELEPFAFEVSSASEDMIFDGNPEFTLHLTNPNDVAATAEITFTVNTDKGKKFASVEMTREVAAKGSADVTVTTEETVPPGFYKVSGKVNGKRYLAAQNIGVKPFQIESAPWDYVSKEDFEDFWDKAYEQLKAIDMDVSFDPTKRAGTYMVQMNSIPDGLEGDPMVIRGYYIEPAKDGKKHPAIVHYYGYDDFPGTTMLELPSGSSDFAHLWLSTRGQRINARGRDLRSDGVEKDFKNPYSIQWFTVNFGDKDSYYYRGAYMDCVQGIRFLALCDDEKVKDRIDMDHVFVEGMSQGGAFSYAAASLSKEYPVKAVAAAVAFMGDFPDYFTIVPNEGGGFPYMAQTCKKALNFTDDQMYEFLSYFDTKNLATRVSCPIMACIGLLDNICPPHTNIAPYNNALTPASDKKMTFYKDMGHAYPPGWNTDAEAFFKKFE